MSQNRLMANLFDQLVHLRNSLGRPFLLLSIRGGLLFDFVVSEAHPRTTSFVVFGVFVSAVGVHISRVGGAVVLPETYLRMVSQVL